MKRIEHNVQTQEVTEIELTAAEIEVRQSEAAQTAEKIAAENAAYEAKETKKAALLAKLGITEAEAKLLLS
jgi:hypothetical protein